MTKTINKNDPTFPTETWDRFRILDILLGSYKSYRFLWTQRLALQYTFRNYRKSLKDQDRKYHIPCNRYTFFRTKHTLLFFSFFNNFLFCLFFKNASKIAKKRKNVKHLFAFCKIICYNILVEQ